jgi:5-methylcytosine-specific restriction enzyme A
MPQRALHPCAAPGCTMLVQSGAYCIAHRLPATDDRPTAHQRGYGAVWQRTRLAHLRREPLCRDPYHLHPEQLIPATDVDHIVPRTQGGSDRADNLQSLCHSCHSHKTNLQSIRRQKKRLGDAIASNSACTSAVTEDSSRAPNHRDHNIK